MSNLPYKLICLDIDGTLINSNHKIGPDTLQTLRAIAARGVHLAVATGRAGYDAKNFASRLSENGYFIGSNGTVVGSVAENRILYEANMGPETIRRLLNIGLAIDCDPVFYGTSEIVLYHIQDYLSHIWFSLINGSLRRLKHIRCIPSRQRFEKALMDGKVSVSKASYFRVKPSAIELARNLIKEDDRFELAIYLDTCFEVTEKGMNKSWGINKLADYLGIRSDEIIAFGDSENDREMLKYVGCSVAMGNASEAIKAIADRVTDTNDNEGVAKMLKQVYQV